jgi:YegS/Rv2252/BmrU family lipid kinase
VSPSAAVIINPHSGTSRGPEVARHRAALAASVVSSYGCHPDIFVTERRGHARELAAGALARGATIVVAWGGDGTVNEVASAVAFHDASLGVVPSGSGNGLARELGLPAAPVAALTVAVTGPTRVIDCGELDGRLFVNVAGVGLDASIAHRFAALGNRRGFRRYVEIGARELLRFEADEYTIAADDRTIRARALVVAIANARQYGNGAVIAPDARIDDGRLDVVSVAHRSPWAALRHVPKLFSGQLARAPGVWMRTATNVEITSIRSVLYHVDGEPFSGGTSVRARVHPRALRVRVMNDR